MRVTLVSTLYCISVCCGIKINASEIKIPNRQDVCFFDSQSNKLISLDEQSFLKVFNSLDVAFALAQSICNEDERAHVSNSIRSKINQAHDFYIDANFIKFIETIVCFYENLPEILSECNEPQVRDEIFACVNEMMEGTGIIEVDQF